MATLTNGESATLSLDAFASVSVQCDGGVQGTLVWTSAADNLKSDVSAKLTNKTYGPYGVPGSMVITVTAGSLTYTVESETGGLAYDTNGNITGLAGAGGGTISPYLNSGIACTLGDSHFANGFAISGGAALLSQGNSASVNWFCVRSFQRVWVPYGCTNAGVAMSGYTLAVSGYTQDDVIANKLTTAQALNAGWVLLSIGGNDLVSFPTRAFSDHVTKFLAIVKPLLAAGKKILCITIPPRAATAGASAWNTTALTGGQITTARRLQMRINEFRRNFAAVTPGFYLADAHAAVVDPTSATGDPLTTMVVDGLHLNTLGSFTVGAEMANAIAYVIPQSYPGLGNSQADIYDATDNPYGNMLVSDGGTLNGTAGTVGTGGTGDAPSSYTANRESGTNNTWVGTTQARSDGKNGREWSAAVTGLETGTIRLFQTTTMTAANWSTGDYGFMEFEVDMSSITGTNQGVTAFWRHVADPSSTTYATYGMIPTSSEVLGTTAWSGIIRTPMQQIYSGIGSTVGYPRLQTINSGNFTCKIRRPRIQKVDVQTGTGLILPPF